VDTHDATNLSFPYEPRKVGLQMRSKFLSNCLDKLRACHLSVGIRTATSAICCEKYKLYVVPMSVCGSYIVTVTIKIWTHWVRQRYNKSFPLDCLLNQFNLLISFTIMVTCDCFKINFPAASATVNTYAVLFRPSRKLEDSISVSPHRFPSTPFEVHYCQ
jgi:hypothetical protein